MVPIIPKAPTTLSGLYCVSFEFFFHCFPLSTLLLHLCTFLPVSVSWKPQFDLVW